MCNAVVLAVLVFMTVLFNCGWISYRTLASGDDGHWLRGDDAKKALTKTTTTTTTTAMPATAKSRRRRDMWQLYGVIRCTTPCDPLILKNYGCYCGLGGTGSPMDDIDRCCMLHDYCYHNTPCHQALTYFLPYNWKCIAGRPFCSIPPRWTPVYACSLHLCECDRMFSECLHDYGCPKDKTVCGSDRYRRIWQKFLIKLGIG